MHPSFRLGADTSTPMFAVSGEIENLLAALEEGDINDGVRTFARTSISASFFENVISKNEDLLKTFRVQLNAAWKHGWLSRPHSACVKAKPSAFHGTMSTWHIPGRRRARDGHRARPRER